MADDKIRPAKDLEVAALLREACEIFSVLEHVQAQRLPAWKDKVDSWAKKRGIANVTRDLEWARRR